MELPDGFEKDDADGGGEVEAADALLGDGEALGRIFLQEGVGQAFAFAAKNEVVSAAEGFVPVGAFGFGGEVEESGFRPGGGLQGGEVRPAAAVDVFPIVEAGTLQGAVINIESQWPDEVKNGAGGEAKAADIAGVGRNFRLDEDDVEHDFGK